MRFELSSDVGGLRLHEFRRVRWISGWEDVLNSCGKGEVVPEQERSNGESEASHD